MRLSLLLAALAAFALSPSAHAQACPDDAVFCDTFDDDADGWIAQNSSHAPTGGDPGGYFLSQSSVPRLTPLSPGDLSGAFGGSITFSAFGVGGSASVPAVNIGNVTGGAEGLVILDPSALPDGPGALVGAAWATYTVPLTPGPYWLSADSGLEPATAQELSDALATGAVVFTVAGAPFDGTGGAAVFSEFGLDNVAFAPADGGGLPELRLAASRDRVVTFQTFTVDVTVGEIDAPVTDLFGASLDVAYDALNLLFVDFVPDPDFIDCDGDPDTEDNLLLIRPEDGSVSVAVSRRADRCTDGVSGDTRIGELVFEVPGAVPGGFATLTPSDVSLVDIGGTESLAFPVGDAVEVIPGVTVWPGDTDAGGAVTSADILPIASRFGETGPARASGDQGYVWAPVPVADWPTASDAFADANGDGEIDEADALAVGLNYGRTVPGAAPLGKGAPVATVTLRPLAAGETFDVAVRLNADGLDALGVSALFTLPDGLAVDAAGASTWLDDGDLLAFDSTTGGRADIAASRKRGADLLSGDGEAIHLVLRALTDLPETTLTLDRLAVGTVGGTIAAAPETVEIESTVIVAGETALSAAFGLSAPAPNPSRAATRIAFALDAPGPAHLAVYDALGRQVAVLADGTLAAGDHAATLDTSRIAPGVYVVRLAVGDRTDVRRLTVTR